MTKRVISMALALMLVLTCFAGLTVSAEENEYGLFIAYGGDKVGDTNWANSYWGSGDAPEGMTVVSGTIKEGETVTVSITFAEATSTTWIVAPCLTGNGIGNATAIDFDITCKIDGQEVAIDMAADTEGRTWWAEGTGDFAGTECVRLAGTYNEWGQKFISVPASITSIEYTVTLNDVSFGDEAPVEPAGPEFGLFIAYGGDKVGDTNWANSYWGSGDAPEGMTVVSGTIKEGETVTVSITFAEATSTTWIVAPCLTGNGIGNATAIDFDITCKIDGQEVAIDMAADTEGRTWWAEGTGDFAGTECVRLAGTYNEWGQKFISVPASITSIEYTVTLNDVSFGDETPVVPEGPAYDMFIAFGGDKGETGWGYEYYGAETEKSAGITATNGQIRVGETITISLAFDEAPTASYFFAPCLVVEDATLIGDIDFDIICKINGEEVAIDMAADSQGRIWWAEGTGDYDGTKCIRLAGGYNEWGAKFVTLPESITSIEYTITLNAVTEAPPAGSGTESTEEYRLLLGFQGGKTAEAWDLAYFGNAVEGITAVEATVKSGDTATISLTFDSAVGEIWYFMPLLVGPGAGDQICLIDFDMVLKIDGVEVPINWEADAEGKTWWQEGTDSFKAEDCIRMGGGYNEWATKYVEKTTGFTTIEYTITFNSIQLRAEEEEPPVVEIDPMGTYHAYLMLQTPNWTFRNAHDDAYYGMEGSSWEALGLSWGQYLVHQDHPGETWGVVTDAVIAGNGTYSVSITDFGTIFADDFAAAGQEYFNIIAISTDLPAGANVTITNVELVIDGKVRHTYPEAYINEESTGTLQILIQNIWNSDVKELSYYPAPTQSLEIRFTISGFSYDQEGGNENPDETQPSTPAETKPAETKPNASQPAATDPTAPPAPADNNTVIIVVIVAVVIVAAVVVVVISKKKKA